MGNLRSVEKALERVGAEAEITRDLEAAESADGVILPGVGAFPKAMERVREIGLDELVARPHRGGPTGARDLPRHAASVRELLRERGGERPRADGRAPSGRCSANGYKVPHIGWSPVRWEHDSRADRGPRPGAALLLRPLVRPAAERARERARHRRLRRALRLRRRARRRSTASSSTPRSRAPRACACSRTSLASARPDPGLILYPAIDIRDGRAVRLLQGDYERETAYDDDPVVAAMRWETDGAPAGSTSSTSTGPATARRSTSTTCGGSSPRSASRSSSAAACATRARSRRRSRPASSASCSAPPPCATPRRPRRSPPRTATASSRPWTPRRAGWPPRAGPGLRA